MRTLITTFAVSFAAFVSLVNAQTPDDPPIDPFIELQSGPLTPGLVLDESPRPVHQIRLIVDPTFRRGTLILDSNLPEFDEFGELVGGIDTPQVRDADKGDKKFALEFRCTIETFKEGPENWRLYRIDGPKLRTFIRIAAKGSIDDGGPVRLIVLGPDAKAKAVVACTRYGLVVP